MSVEKQPWWPTSGVAKGVLFGSFALGLVLKARLVFSDDGINWPDEVYQSFEPAHRLVFGHALVAWEYLEGARTWMTPGFVAAWLWLCKLVGADAPTTYIPVVKLVFVLLVPTGTSSTDAALAIDGISRLQRTHRRMTRPLSKRTGGIRPQGAAGGEKALRFAARRRRASARGLPSPARTAPARGRRGPRSRAARRARSSPR